MDQHTPSSAGQRSVVQTPAPIKDVIALVRRFTAEFEPAVGALEEDYSPEVVEELYRGYAAACLSIGERGPNLGTGWADPWPRDENADPVRPDFRLPDHLVLSLAHPNLAPAVPLRLAFEEATKEPWHVDRVVCEQRVADALRLAVIACLAFDPDVGEYLGRVSSWARVPWRGTGPDELWVGRWMADGPEDHVPQRWTERCAAILEVLAAPHWTPGSRREKPRWTKDNLDTAIRDLRSRYAQNGTFQRWCEHFNRKGKPHQGATVVFGRNQLAKKLGCSAGLVSTSSPWRAIRAELGLGQKPPADPREEDPLEREIRSQERDMRSESHVHGNYSSRSDLVTDAQGGHGEESAFGDDG